MTPSSSLQRSGGGWGCRFAKARPTAATTLIPSQRRRLASSALAGGWKLQPPQLQAQQEARAERELQQSGPASATAASALFANRPMRKERPLGQALVSQTSPWSPWLARRAGVRPLDAWSATALLRVRAVAQSALQECTMQATLPHPLHLQRRLGLGLGRRHCTRPLTPRPLLPLPLRRPHSQHLHRQRRLHLPLLQHPMQHHMQLAPGARPQALTLRQCRS